MSKRPWQESYERRFYNKELGWVDGTTEFHDLCSSAISPGSRILEVGAGPTNTTTRFLSTLGEVHGVDPDPAIAQNADLASAHLLAGHELPFEAQTFDACVSNYVVEHVASPESHLEQTRRVLKPGAPYIFRTSNVNHFVYRISSLTPHGFHNLAANRLRSLPGEAHEPYPTVYAMNSPKQIAELAASSRFSVDVLRPVEKNPSYGRSSRALFLLFTAYERAVNSSDRLAFLRAIILCVLRRDFSAG